MHTNKKKICKQSKIKKRRENCMQDYNYAHGLSEFLLHHAA